MNDLDKVKKIINAYDAEPKKCPYCFKTLKAKLSKAESSVRYYCSFCEQSVDFEWDYLHAIAIRVEKYMVLSDNAALYYFKKANKE
jgi:transcription elongation factor Elf1